MHKFLIVFLTLLSIKGWTTHNQTDDLSSILPQDTLPFTISIVPSGFQLPPDNLGNLGLQSYVFAVYDGKWLLFNGRTNGLHGFNPNNNFPPELQNTTVYVVDPKKQTVKFKSLTDASSHLSQAQIDTLSVTASEFFQVKDTLYVIGGYGVDTATGEFGTKSTLSAIDVPGLIQWVESSKGSAKEHIRQTSHPLLQVTGGSLVQADPHQPFLLVFGQNFIGSYVNDGPTGEYTEQVRAFQIIDNGRSLHIQPEKQHTPNPNYRRRDLNIVPIIQKSGSSYQPAFAALSGVFTEASGIWTVPVLIKKDGSSSMPDPSNPNTFKQGMNNYICPYASLFSKKTNEMFTLLFGGISYLSVDDHGNFVPNPEIPFINSVTTIKIDAHGNFQQYLMGNEYPLIPADFGSIGMPLLFGASGHFIPAGNLPTFSNGVFSLDNLGSAPILLGYILGGIESSEPDTNTMADSAASPYIFSVILQRQ